MYQPVKLPDIIGDAADPAAALGRLNAVYDTNEIQRMVRFFQANETKPAIKAWIDGQAAMAVNAQMHSAHQNYGAARRTIAGLWGFSGESVTNFVRRCDAGWRRVYGSEPDRPRGSRP